MATPNMSLVLPTPGIGGTTGPTWASNVNTALETVDEHDHTPGKGTLIPSAGLQIDGDVSFNDYNLTTTRTLRMSVLSVTPALADDLNILYSKNGELTYRDASGNEVPITSGGSVAGATGTISGLSSPAAASFSSVTDTFSWVFDTGSAAKMALADLVVYPYNGSTVYTDSVTIKAPTSLAASYALTLPGALPAVTYPLTVTAAGVIAASGSILVADGSSGSPSIAFGTDTDLGLYRVGADVLGINSNSVHFGNGSAAAPSLAFASDVDTGMYRYGTNVIGFATNGVNRLRIDTDQWISDIPLRLSGGTNSTPDFSFNGDSDLGVYRIGANVLGITCGGTESLRVSASGLSTDGSTFTKFKLYTGSLTSGNSTVIDVGANVFGYVGYSTVSGGSQWQAMIQGDEDVSDHNSIVASGGGGVTSGTDVRLVNRDSNTNNYRIVVFHA